MHDITLKASAAIRSLPAPLLRSLLFAVLLAASTAVGAVPVPGTPVPVTMQTFVLMLAGLLLPVGEAVSATVMYLSAGSLGLPVFAGGGSTASLVGPSAGFLLGFLPAVLVMAAIAGGRDRSAPRTGRRKSIEMILGTLRRLLACVIGGIAVDYALGITVQTILTGVALPVVASSSLVFVPGDLVKAVVATLIATGTRPLFRRHRSGSPAIR
ncbi:biotin transporter BioY [uncultured Bifidobacterium sp.]|uniref:biotin transporter BioY n=1 Tax=uncultured Bifidobacterium sp. TaxID=165187 RepID=UPI0028DBB37E|nr:biotin transporter BioY [uncultured Bifidobacterium sp.]